MKINEKQVFRKPTSFWLPCDVVVSVGGVPVVQKSRSHEAKKPAGCGEKRILQALKPAVAIVLFLKFTLIGHS